MDKKIMQRRTDTNERPKTRQQKDSDWETVVKMTIIARDLMVGTLNSKNGFR
jgi:hypothetical protein